MKYTDRELDRLLEKLIASTRSPRGKFSAAASYQILEKRLPRPALRLFSLRTLSAVAAIALLCFIGWNTYCYLKPAALQTISTLADTRTIKLPDGTEVTLNHFSSLTYPEKFKGEHSLKPNESAIYNKEKKSMTLEVSDRVAEEIAWRNGELIFTNLPLQEIARQLSNTFGVDISITDTALQNYRITARFSSEEGLDQILDLLHTVGNFNYSYNNKEITITTKLN